MAKLASKLFKDKALRRLVDQARQDTFFLGRALAVYQRLHDMDDKQLTLWLECSGTELDRLALCRLPDGQQGRFQQDVRKIADFTSCNPDRLAQVLREAGAWEAFQEDGEKLSDRFLLAARDHKPDGDDDTSGGQE